MSRRHRASSVQEPALTDAHGCPPGDGERVASLRAALPDSQTREQLAEVFRLLGDPGRVGLLLALLEAGEICVHDLATVAGQSESAVSHSLRLLRAHRVVTVRRSGRLAFYRLADGHVRMLLDVALTHLGHAPALRVRPADPTTNLSADAS